MGQADGQDMSRSDSVENEQSRRKVSFDDEIVDVLQELADSSPKGKAVERFEKMVNVQIETLNGIDEKAEYLTRFVGILLGVVLTGLSLIPKFDGVTLTANSLPMLISIFVGIFALLATLGFSIITYLSSKFEYGISSDVAEYFADTDVTEDEYAELLPRGYADIIPKNREVVRVNSRRFRNALASLLAGLGCLSQAAFFLVVEIPTYGKYVVLVLGFGILGLVLRYVLTEDYLTLNRVDEYNE